jgi:hypothetical protein
MVKQKPDLVVSGADGIPQLTVEVKNPKEMTLETAEDFFKNVAPYLASYSPYVMLVSESQGFIWRQNALNGRSEPQVFSMQQILCRYAGTMPHGRRLRGSELEILVWRWLTDLTRRSIDKSQVPVPAPLQELLPAITGGSVEMDGGD